MVQPIPDILARIVAHKHSEMAGLRAQLGVWERTAFQAAAKRRDFAAALTANPPAVIAEVKKASPSKGLLAPDFDPVRIASAYAAGGAAALSVLTDERFFQGKLDDLIAARTAVPIPVLRKDFTLDPVHVVQAAAHHADAILLIAGILTTTELRALRELAEKFGMSALVEVHDEAELDRAVESGAQILGVNNRDLRTFEVRLETSLRLARRMPPNVVRVSESGIHSAGDVRLLAEVGYHAFLVGEHLMRSGDAAGALRLLRGA
ncbi:MAG: indole-3-glycerol phosphate synthase TrpC [Acidobacteria bacterium]|nr:indole-3-glycerol phosphate synthase TrpC [Acidobacteriota bacterium]